MGSSRIEALISEFRQYGIHRRGTNYFCRRTALEIVDRCEAIGICILGIDGFYLTADSTEQPIDWILDLSGARTGPSAYNVARMFFQNASDLPLFYEFVLDDPANTDANEC
jgi:hypothetical protein